MWILATVVLFLNPISATFLIKNITSPNAYWRLFYIYPFPIIVGITISSLIYRMQNKFLRNVTVIFICGFLFVAHFLLPEASIFRGSDVKIGMPTYKVSQQYLLRARQAIALAPEGPMLAPSDLAGIIVMLDSDYPQLRIRETAERVWLSSQDRYNEAEWRIAASNYLDGKGNDFSSLKMILEKQENIQSVIIDSTIFGREQVKELLLKHRFIHHAPINDYVVVWK